ncbi:hypothetical protein Tco_0528763 [Tanacetum coccineum]
MQNIPSSTPYVPPTKNDWEILFQLMFDEYLNPPPCVDPHVPAVIAPEPAVSTSTPSSTTIDQDAPATKNGNAPQIKKVVKGVETTIAPTTAEKRHKKDAKSLQAVKKRFGGNAATKKT